MPIGLWGNPVVSEEVDIGVYRFQPQPVAKLAYLFLVGLFPPCLKQTPPRRVACCTSHFFTHFFGGEL
jgi:hypothetical protein